MKLYFVGHSYQYAAEQLLFSLFPGEKPEYPAGAPGEAGAPWAELTLQRGPGVVTAAAALSFGGKRYEGVCREDAPPPADALATKRVEQQALKLAFYDAGVQALGQAPPWGALTGVRPVKIPAQAMAGGSTEAQAEAVLAERYHVSPLRRRLAMDCAAASLAVSRSLGPNEISLYIGIPFCPTRCAYCSFISADVKRSLGLVAPFLEALLQEVDAAGALLRENGLTVRTVYMGGGTPTTLSALQLDTLMGRLAARLDLSHCTEYTVEAGRPDTITADKLSAIRANGGGRVSVNPQSMSDGVLRAMGRAHTAADILRAYDLVRAAGIPAVNMDLIAGLPTDTAAGFRQSLDGVLALGPENVTVHTLALKKGSRLMEQGGALPAPGEVSQMLDYAWQALGDAGQRPYYLYRQKYMSGSFENVGWAKPGWESVYNICMMEELHTVLSLGGGGVTKLVNPATGQIVRMGNPKYPQEYLEKLPQVLEHKKQLTGFYAGMREEQL